MQDFLYKITFGFFWLVSLMPLSVHYFFSDFLLYPLIYHLIGYRKKVVRENLKGSFPEKSDQELKDIERKFYHFFCDYIVENIKTFSMSKEEMMRRMTFTNLEEAEPGYAEGKVIMFLYLAHYCDWEWIASMPYWSPDRHISQIYHPLYNKVTDRIFLHLREQYGGESIPMKKTLRRCIQMRTEFKKVVIGCISDQLPKWNSIHYFTKFLGRDTATFIGTEQMAKKLNGIVYYGRMSRPKRGYYNCELIKITHNPKEFPDYQLTDIYSQLLEEDIRREPHLWLWSHKRWKRTKEEWEERKRQAKNDKEDKDDKE